MRGPVVYPPYLCRFCQINEVSEKGGVCSATDCQTKLEQESFVRDRPTIWPLV